MTHKKVFCLKLRRILDNESFWMSIHWYRWSVYLRWMLENRCYIHLRWSCSIIWSEMGTVMRHPQLINCPCQLIAYDKPSNNIGEIFTFLITVKHSMSHNLTKFISFSEILKQFWRQKPGSEFMGHIRDRRLLPFIVQWCPNFLHKKCGDDVTQKEEIQDWKWKSS